MRIALIDNCKLFQALISLLCANKGVDLKVYTSYLHFKNIKNVNDFDIVFAIDKIDRTFLRKDKDLLVPRKVIVLTNDRFKTCNSFLVLKKGSPETIERISNLLDRDRGCLLDFLDKVD